mmetsp:Transcript_2186/g.5039  ORF Transcript_2186/g.5039 Transcript_2186/m.5039 type:complete len:94 (-) Transcript_2186:517-798(-)|eukprot:CAMPEP_0171498242 /NCGR_PEP_ID=MMETSP0958-20121227/7737_1 /TAXON_ID=87120 /ORGANISM="Aurantiochytrium limacinum, Strain ATCCMYA-1381" /LENGTH=93 /DNA_ID=CAMNT_0012032611 /DNA_START=171 /DNA_END=452 /DNA_ORIENTATION=+
MSGLGRAADVVQRTLVAGLIGATGFLAYTSINQTVTLAERRKALESKLRELEEQGVVPEGTAAGKVKGIKLDMQTMQVTYNDEVVDIKPKKEE